MNLAFMRALVARDAETATHELGAEVGDTMTDDLASFARYRLAQMEADPSVQQWLGRAMVITDPGGRRHAIGTLGFHGPPDAQGRVEVGYRIEPPYRRRGYTSEAVRALFDWAAREHGIRRFVASVSPTNGPSLALIRGLGFSQVGEQMDEIDGLELVFEAPWPPEGEELARVDDDGQPLSPGT
jgi:[ribosomal protein S5]-alanine N-acetyltransferase